EVVDGVRIRRVSPGQGSRWQRMATYLLGMVVAALRIAPNVDVIQVQQALYPAAVMAILAACMRKPLVIRNSGSGEFGGISLMQRMPLGGACLKLMSRMAIGVSLSSEMAAEMRQAGFVRLRQIP